MAHAGEHELSSSTTFRTEVCRSLFLDGLICHQLPISILAGVSTASTLLAVTFWTLCGHGFVYPLTCTCTCARQDIETSLFPDAAMAITFRRFYSMYVLVNTHARGAGSKLVYSDYLGLPIVDVCAIQRHFREVYIFLCPKLRYQLLFVC